MGLINFLRQIFRKKPKEALQSARTSASIGDSSASTSLQSEIQALQTARALEALQAIQSVEEKPKEKATIELEKESLQLGVAAGYVGRSLREIENSLLRIESQMITKDWFNLELKEKLLKLLKIVEEHEKEEEMRFKALQSAIEALRSKALELPEPFKSELSQQIDVLESSLPLTSKMKRVMEILRETKEISYKDLAKRLGISVSSLRGLLTNMCRRTQEIERFTRNGVGWVRLKEFNNAQNA